MHDQEEKCEGIPSYINFDLLTERQTVDQDQHHVMHVPSVMTGSTYLHVPSMMTGTTYLQKEQQHKIDRTNDTTDVEIELTNDTTDVEFKCDDLSCYLDYSWLQCKTSQRKMVKETSKSLVEETSKSLVEETSKTLVEETSKTLVEETSKTLVEETSKTLADETSNIGSIDAIYEQGHRSHPFSTNNHIELDIPFHRQKIKELNMAVSESEYNVQEEIMDIGDIVYQHSLYNNTTILTQHQDKVGNWEEKNSTLHVLPTISTDVCINTESQDNDSEIIGSNVTELVHGNVCFENQRSEVENSHCSVINEQMPFDEKLDSSSSSLQIPDTDLDNTTDSTTNEHQYEYKVFEYGDHTLGKHINLVSKENAFVQTTHILNESSWQNKLTFNQKNDIPVGDSLKLAQSEKIVNFDHKFGKKLTKSLTKSSDFSSYLMNLKGRWQVILDRLKTSSHNSHVSMQNLSVQDSEKPKRYSEYDLIDLEQNDTRDRLSNEECPRNDIDECYDKNVDEKDSNNEDNRDRNAERGDFENAECYLQNNGDGDGRKTECCIQDIGDGDGRNMECCFRNIGNEDGRNMEYCIPNIEDSGNTECCIQDIGDGDGRNTECCIQNIGDGDGRNTECCIQNIGDGDGGNTECCIQDIGDGDGRNTDCCIQNIEDSGNTECCIQDIGDGDGRNTECCIQNIGDGDGRNTECCIQNIGDGDGRNTECCIQNIGDGDSMYDSINVECCNTTVCTENSNVDILKKGHCRKDIDKENAHIKTTDRQTNKLIVCKACPGFIASTITKMLAHENTTFHIRRKFGESGLKSKKYECNVCSCRFGRSHTLRYHYQRQHAKYRAEGDTKNCIQCNKYRRLTNKGRLSHESSASYSALKTHFKSHIARTCSSKQSEGHSCEICCQPFRSKQNLDDHMTTHFENNSNQCLLCDRDFSDWQSLIDHIPIHSDTQMNQNKDEHDFISNCKESDVRLQSEEPISERSLDCMEIKILNLPVSQNWKNIHWKKNRNGHSKITKAVCKTCPNFTAFSSHMVRLHEQMTFHIRDKFGEIGLRLLKHECCVCSARFKYKNQKRNHFKRRHLQQLTERAIIVSVNRDGGCDNKTEEPDGTCDYENKTNQSENGTERQDNIDNNINERKIHNKKTRHEKDINTMHHEYEVGIRSKRSRNETYNQQQQIITNTQEHLNKCDLCCQSFSSEKCLNDHIITHFQSTTFKCELCKTEFEDRKTLINHIPIHSTPKVPCDLCTKFFMTEDKLRIHKMGYHHMTGSDSFECVICGRVFKSEQWLNNHITNIHIDKMFTCETCGKVFKSRDTLRNHRISMHTKDYPYRCHICGNGFVLPCQLNQHIIEHDGKERYQCHICNAKFSVKWKHLRHVSKHKIEKRKNNPELMFVCEICGKNFLRNFNLQMHLKVHSGEKSYKCEICGRSFGRSDNLYTHLRTHTGQKPYCCDTCGKQFARGDNLKTHIKKMHF